MKKMKKLVFASNNQGKIKEVKQILGSDFEILSLKDINCVEDIPETHFTIKENAIEKAEYIFNKYGFACISDDTGLEVDALNNEPGVFSARYAGVDKSPEKNMQKLLKNLNGIENRKAHFSTFICYIDNDGNKNLFEGRVDGTITKEKHGDGGFGYDPIFMPDGYSQTFGELGETIKNTISHRYRALKKLQEFFS